MSNNIIQKTVLSSIKLNYTNLSIPLLDVRTRLFMYIVTIIIKDNKGKPLPEGIGVQKHVNKELSKLEITL